MTQLQGARQCPRCSQPIKGASLVVFTAGAFFHHGCLQPHVELDHPICEFLRRHYPSGFCVDCLRTALNLTDAEAKQFVRGSRGGRPFVILLGARCAHCRQSRLTVQAAAYDERPLELAPRVAARRRPEQTDGTVEP